MTLGAEFGRTGWARVPADATSRRWAEAAFRNARETLRAAPSNQWRAGGTWCVGLDLLENRPDGSLHDAPAPPAIRAALQCMGCDDFPLHKAQVSLVRPGYPRPEPGESDAAHRFRQRRDAAHVDGLIAEGAGKRRVLREWHGIVIGIALNRADAGAAPLVVWPGSHRMIGPSLKEALAGRAPETWGETDIAPPYKAARARVLETCTRIPVPLSVGESVILHRHILHGIAPWEAGAEAEGEGRMVAYFRPVTCPTAESWIAAR